MNSLDLQVNGMTCMSCATTIKNLLLHYKFVKDVEINIILNSVRVILNKKITLDERKKICDTINNAGFICLLKSSTIMNDMLTLSINDFKLEEKSLESEIIYGNSKDIAEQILNSKGIKFLKLHQIPTEEMKLIVKALENKAGIITIISYLKWGQLCILFDENQITIVQIQEILEKSDIWMLSYMKFYCLFGKEKLSCVNNLKIKCIFRLNSDREGISIIQKIYNCLRRRNANIEFNKDFTASIGCIVSGIFGIYNVSVERMNENNFERNLVLMICIDYNPYFISGRNLLKYMNDEVLKNYVNETIIDEPINENKLKKQYSHRLVNSMQIITKCNLDESVNYSSLQKIKDKESRYYVICFTISLILTIMVLLYNFLGDKPFMSKFTRIISFNTIKSLQDQTGLSGISWKYLINLILVTIVVYLCGYTFHKKGIKSMLYLNPNMYSLISLGTNTCYLYSFYMMIYLAIISSKDPEDKKIYSDRLPNFFDIACMLITISLFGRILDVHSNLLILRIINNNSDRNEVIGENGDSMRYNIKDNFQLLGETKFESLEKVYYHFSNSENCQVLPLASPKDLKKNKEFRSKYKNTEIGQKTNTMSIDSICLDDISPQSMEMKEQSSIINNVVNVDLIDLGDVIILKKDEIVPYDGIVISSDIAVLDESMITGESRIIEKLYGNFISSGSRVLSDNVLIFVTEMGTESTLGKIQKLKIKARESQIELPGIIDKFSRYFVPSIILLSLLAFVVWFLLAYYDKVDPARMFNTDRINFNTKFNNIFKEFPISSRVMFALHFSLSIMAISCPCVIGITVPIAVLISTSLTSKKNILVQNTNIFNNIGFIDNIVFDKTGTLTNGRPTVKSIIVDHENIQEITITTFNNGYSSKWEKPTDIDFSNSSIETFYINKNSNIQDKNVVIEELFESYLKFWWIIGSCEYYNNHPAGNVLRSFSIRLFNNKEQYKFTQPIDCRYIPGVGMTCIINRMKVLITNQYKHLDQDFSLVSVNSKDFNHYIKSSSNTLEISLDSPENKSTEYSSLYLRNWLKYWSKKGSMIIYIFIGDINNLGDNEHGLINAKYMKLVGAVSMIDEPMFGVESTINYMKKHVTDQIWLCSGDSFYTSNSIASMIGIDSDKIMSNSTPSDKLHLIQDLQLNKELDKISNIDLNEEKTDKEFFKSFELEFPVKNEENIKKKQKKSKKNLKKVMMIGDGINDSASIEAADIGILLGKGGINNFTHADVIILSNYQNNIKFLFKLGR
ncbi:E1-E2 ATPase family protein [Cryptosporidium meleagridis]|uniref:E1-E2 ATPase family protein n=1 Tax=Cryptosporidium meleagridis TaxID=93969 RepID=A0A2P4Z2M2_9CRYT|nr:E1-E2 ATPase family protein [Cryptosporidium meleagridis]